MVGIIYAYYTGMHGRQDTKLVDTFRIDLFKPKPAAKAHKK